MSDFHVVSANVIEHDGKFLLVQEGKESVRGQWNLPAGGVKSDESIKEGAVREAYEETGLNVELEGLLGVFTDESDQTDSTVLIFVFSSTPANYDIQVSDGEILDADFFAPEEFSDMNIRVPFLDEAVNRYMEGKIMDIEVLKDYSRLK